MANEQAFQFWYEKERRGEWGASITVTQPPPRAPTPCTRLPAQVDICDTSPPGSTQTSGVVATLKLKWEQIPGRSRQESIGPNNSQSSQVGMLHRPIQKSGLPTRWSSVNSGHQYSNSASRSVKKLSPYPDSSFHKGTTKKFSAGQMPVFAKGSDASSKATPGRLHGTDTRAPVVTQASSQSKSQYTEREALSIPRVKDVMVPAVSSGVGRRIDRPTNKSSFESPHLQKVSDVLKSVEVPEAILINIVVAPAMPIEAAQFWEMIDMLYKKSGSLTQLRPKYPTAPILSQQLERSASNRRGFKSVELLTVVIQIGQSRSTTFQCPYKSKVGSILTKCIEELHDASKISQDFVFKVCGREEYLENDKRFCDYEYVQQCRKFSTKVKVVLTNKKQITCTHTITSRATELHKDIHISQELVSQKEIHNLLGSFYTTEQRFHNIVTVKDLVSSPCTSILVLAQSVVSCVKLICEWLAFIEPPQVTEAVYEFRRACKTATQPEVETSSFFPPEDSCNFYFTSNDSWISVADENHVISKERMEDMLKALDILKTAVHETLSLYCNSFHPGYKPKWSAKPECEESSNNVESLPKIKVCALHRVNEPELRKFESLQIEVSIYHGGRLISPKAHSPLAKVTRNFFCSVVWDKCLIPGPPFSGKKRGLVTFVHFVGCARLNVRVPIRSLPRESRALFVLHGVELPGAGTKQSKTVISWASLNLFTPKGVLKSGSLLLRMWPGDDIDPLASPSFDIEDRESVLLQVSFENRDRAIVFPKESDYRRKKKCSSPSPTTFRTLSTIVQRNRFYCLSSEDESLIWQTRFSCSSHLSNYPRGLPLVLLSTPYWHTDALMDIWNITNSWPLIDATFGLELLDPQFADIHVRAKAVEWLAQLNDDDICDILPQLVQTLQYDCYPCSAMSEFLLARAIASPRISHFLYWNLKLLQTSDVKFRTCSSMMLWALKNLIGTARSMEFANQAELIDQLRAVAYAVKAARDTHRQTTLIHGLQRLTDKFVSKFQLPLDPALLVSGIEIKSCSFFNSNTVPLKITFVNADPFGEPIDVIYKVGDDLRQDILVLQMIKLMEKIWLRVGLDLKMVTYQCVATGLEEGMLEMVTEASTLRAIQTEYGLTGSFKDKPLSEWLMRHNPTDLLYKEAVENFTLSCAGYCVATFVLGICDRHNDNIMVKKSGHMFHIDFGKILGNAQMFGNIKRDRAPFVLTRDMAYVINGSDHPTEKFQKFTDLCCTAYNAVRKHSDLIISLLSLILSSGLPGLTSTDDILYVRDALLPGKSDLEATYTFTKYIAESLSSLATPLNFFIHNLAQFKLSSSSSSQAILSLSSQTYSIATDGKIISATITDTHKRFYPETHYVYQIKVCRKSSKVTTLFRRYREFHEMHARLIQSFPDKPLPPLPGKVLMRHKSLSKQTVEKRKAELNVYLKELLLMEPQLSESDVVYTFLHCLIRDEQDLIKLSEESKKSQNFTGNIQLEILYDISHQSLTVVVRHVKDLVPREGYEIADPYVKIYLLPDHSKETKKKTKIAKRTLNPTYNETFTYTLPPSALNSRMLQLSIWDASNIRSNQCLCMTTIELSKIKNSLMNSRSIIDWYTLHSMQDT